MKLSINGLASSSLRLVYLLIGLLVVSSCDGDRIYKQFDKDFNASRWPKDEVHSYSFNIPSDGNYDLLVHFSHVYDSPLATIPLKLTIGKPSGENELIDVILRLRDADGKQLADCTGDYCDFKQEVFRSRKLPAGNYTLKLRNDFNFAYLPNVLGVGIEVRKSHQ